MAADSAQATSQASSDTDLINEVMQYVEKYNLTGADKDALIRAAIDGMVDSLDDPYSQYFSSDESKELQSQLALIMSASEFSWPTRATSCTSSRSWPDRLRRVPD